MKICYFGIYDTHFSRNRIYIQGLIKAGVEVIECKDSSPGISKWFKLRKRIQAVEDTCDALVVGYPGHIAVPVAKMFSKKLIIADLLGSLSDAEQYSHKPVFFTLLKAKISDALAVKCADIILLESEAQKKYFEERFGLSHTYKVVYTGSYFEPAAPHYFENTRFQVIFRGSLTPESGILYILEAAEMLISNPRIAFKIVGRGRLLEQAKQTINEKQLTNVVLVDRYLEDEEFIQQYEGVSLALGQFENNPRLNRTIPHKVFEAFALGIPLVSGDAKAVREIITEGETGFLVPLADARALAETIESLSENHIMLKRVSRNSQNMFKERFSSLALGKTIRDIISNE